MKNFSRLSFIFLFLFETICCGEAVLSDLQKNTDLGNIKFDGIIPLKDGSAISKRKYKSEKKELAKNTKEIELFKALEKEKNEIETLKKINLGLESKYLAAQESIRQGNEYSAGLNTQLEYHKKLYQQSLYDQSLITKQLDFANRQITKLTKDSTKQRVSKFRSFVLPIGVFLAALLGMGVGVVFSDVIKNVLAILLKKA